MKIIKLVFLGRTYKMQKPSNQLLLKREISYGCVSVRSGWRRPRIALAFLSLQSAAFWF